MKFLVAVLLILSAPALSLEVSAPSKVKLVYSYPEYGGGDVVFLLETQTGTCKGYWLKKDAPGQQATLSLLLAAYHAKTIITATGHPEPANKWPGSSEQYCKLYSLAYGL